MELRPILSAMRRNKVGAILIGVQMAITLAILCNALFIIEQRVTLAKRPTGTDEANVFVITNQWVGSPADLAAKLQADLAALRATPGVVDATASNSYPLSGGGSTEGVLLAPEQKEPTALTALYLVDEHGLNALGLRLIAGRNFNSDEVIDKAGYTDLNPPAAVIITKALADKAFPGKSAVGQAIYSEFPKARVPIVGVVDQLQVPWTQAGQWGSKFSENSTLAPFRFVASYIHYIVRAQPGQIKQVQKAAEKALIDLDRARVIEKNWTLTEARADAYQDDRGLVVILERGVRGAGRRHGVRHRGSHQLLGGAAPPSDRHSPRIGCDPSGHRALLPNGEFSDCRRRLPDRSGSCHRPESLDGLHVRDGAAAHRLCLHRRPVGTVAGTACGAVAGAEGGVRSAGLGDTGGVRHRLRPARVIRPRTRYH